MHLCPKVLAQFVACQPLAAAATGKHKTTPSPTLSPPPAATAAASPVTAAAAVASATAAAGGAGGGGFPGMGPMGGFPGMGGPNIRVFHNGVQVNPQMFVQKPEPLNKTVHIDLQTAYLGMKMPLEIERAIIKNGIQSSELETIYIDIPQGIDNNETIQINDKGHIVNDVKGDIRISVQISNNTQFHRNGLDLIYKKKVSLKESLCGFIFEMSHLNGKKICLNNTSHPTVIKPNYKKVVPNMGMIRDGSTGNMILEFEVEFPDTLTAEQITGLLEIL
jgi:DnaJ-class molecular chaperone